MLRKISRIFIDGIIKTRRREKTNVKKNLWQCAANNIPCLFKSTNGTEITRRTRIIKSFGIETENKETF